MTRCSVWHSPLHCRRPLTSHFWSNPILFQTQETSNDALFSVAFSFALPPAFDFTLLVPTKYPTVSGRNKFILLFDGDENGKSWMNDMTQFLAGRDRITLTKILKEAVRLHQKCPKSTKDANGTALNSAAVATSSKRGASPVATAKQLQPDDKKKAKSSDKDQSEEDCCAVCRDALRNGQKCKVLHKCKHEFHSACIEQCFKLSQKMCPICKTRYGLEKGNQPPGRMRHRVVPGTVPGHNCNKHIVIEYDIPSSVQTTDHPHPGEPFEGFDSRTAYLPDTPDGWEVLLLLKAAFDHGLIFTVGFSITKNEDNQVVWRGIHHKTSLTGGEHSFGYPDPDYFDRVKKELEDVGVTPEFLRVGGS